MTLEILDCTIRDASYPISYQFTAEDTAVIAAGLEHAGFRKIEIGHGLGIGASSERFGVSAASDEAYLDAAASVLTTASFGVFAIPGIAGLEHVSIAARHGAGFFRIGTNVTETEDAAAFLARAKELGLWTSANLMKTYAVPLGEVVRRAEQLVAWGADVVSVVDSAGGMLPNEVRAYVAALTDAIGDRVGFHGHNNLQLAVANSLVAIEAGAVIVDATMKGLGRSSGNAGTEALVLALLRSGTDLGIDVVSMLDLGDKVIGPMAGGRAVHSVELASGYALFHSSFLPMVDRVATELGVDVRRLIIAVSAREKIEVSEALVREVAADLESTTPGSGQLHRSFDWQLDVRIAETATLEEMARGVADELRAVARKSARLSIFTVALAPPGVDAPSFPFTRSSQTAVIGNAEVVTVDQGVALAQAVQGVVDVILVDVGAGADLLAAVERGVDGTPVVAYRDDIAHLDAAEALVAHGMPVDDAVVAICGLSAVGIGLAVRLAQRGASVRLWDDGPHGAEIVALLERWTQLDVVSGSVRALDPSDKVDVLVGARVRSPVVVAELLDQLTPDGTVLDVGVGSLAPDAVRRAIEDGIRVQRLDMRAGLTGQVTAALESRDLVSDVAGRATIGDVEVVAGGVLGARGTVVVDAASAPTRVIGVADGVGGLLDGAELAAFEDTVRSVTRELVARRLR